MCKKIFIAATGQHTGKTTISISLMHLARKKYSRVGFIKPIGPKCVTYHGITMDMDAVLMASIYGLNQDIRFMSPVVLPRGTTRKYLDQEFPLDYQKELLVSAIHELEQRHDLLIIEGSGHGGVGSILGLNNAQVARLADAPVLMITNGGIGNVVDSVELNLALYEKHHADVRMVLVNKLVPEKRESTLELSPEGLQWFIPEDCRRLRLLGHPRQPDPAEHLPAPETPPAWQSGRTKPDRASHPPRRGLIPDGHRPPDGLHPAHHH